MKECPICHEARAIPVSIIINYIGTVFEDNTIINDNPIHSVVCWNCGSIRILDLDELKRKAVEAKKVIVFD